MKEIDDKRSQIFVSRGIVPISSAAQSQLDEIKATQDEFRRKVREAGLEVTRAIPNTQSQRSVYEIE